MSDIKDYHPKTKISKDLIYKDIVPKDMISKDKDLKDMIYKDKDLKDNPHVFLVTVVPAVPVEQVLYCAALL